MQNERHKSFKINHDLPYQQQKDTTFTNLVKRKKNISNVRRTRQGSGSQVSNKEEIRSQSPARSLHSQTEMDRSISLLLSTHLPQLKGKTYKPRYSTFLLPKKRNTHLPSKKYDFQLPIEQQKYQFDLTDEYEFHKTDEDEFWRGISINVHLNSALILGDIIVTLAIFTVSAFSALFVAFDNIEAGKLSVRLIHYICLGFFVVRNIIQCIKITTHKRKLIYRLKDIIKYRLSLVIFWIDFLIIVLLSFSIYYYNSQALGLAIYLVTFLKAFFMGRNFFILERTYLDSQHQHLYWDLFKMMVLNIFFAHFFATVLVSLYYVNQQKNWIVHKNLQNEQWYIIYIWAFYWAAGIIPSIGFGDIVPVYYQQALIVALFKLLTYGVFVLIDLVRMQAIIALQYSLVRKIGIFRENSKKDEIPQKLCQKIERYLRRKEKDDTIISYRERIHFIQQLPMTLQKKYLREFSSQRLRTLPFFHLLSLKTLGQISLRIYDRYYTAMDMIIKSSKIQPDRISILKCGTIGFLYKKNGSQMNGTIVHKIQVDWQIQKYKNPFLIDQFFLQKFTELKYNVRAEKYTKLLHINVQDFFTVIRQNQNQTDKEFFFQLIHRHQKDQNEWCQIKCQYCPRKYHTLFDCPKIHYIPFRDIIYLKDTQPATFLVQNQRNILYDRIRTRYRQRFKRNHFYLRRFYSVLQKRIGVIAHKKPMKLLWLIQEQQEESPQPLYPKTPLVHEEISKKKPQKLKLKRSKSEQQFKVDFIPYFNFFDKEYLYQQNRQTIIESDEKSKFRELKNKLFDVITGILQPFKGGFWKLQIDKMHNYKNYFQDQNPENLKYLPLKNQQDKKKKNLNLSKQQKLKS